MGYSNESRQRWAFETVTAVDVLTATGDAAATFVCWQPITVLRVGMLVTVAVGGDTATVAFDRRITAGSDTGRVDGGVTTVVVPASTAAGKIVYKDVRVDLDAGDEVVPEVTEVSAAGSVRYFVEYVNRHEVPANMADLVAGT